MNAVLCDKRRDLQHPRLSLRPVPGVYDSRCFYRVVLYHRRTQVIWVFSGCSVPERSVAYRLSAQPAEFGDLRDGACAYAPKASRTECIVYVCVCARTCVCVCPNGDVCIARATNDAISRGLIVDQRTQIRLRCVCWVWLQVSLACVCWSALSRTRSSSIHSNQPMLFQ